MPVKFHNFFLDFYNPNAIIPVMAALLTNACREAISKNGVLSTCLLWLIVDEVKKLSTPESVRFCICVFLLAIVFLIYFLCYVYYRYWFLKVNSGNVEDLNDGTTRFDY